MTVTELALLRLSPGTTITSPCLRANLLHAENAMESSSTTRQPFLFYHCVEDPSLIYLIGSWASVSAHMDIFIPSPTNQECLALMKDQLKVEWMFHLDLGVGELPLREPVLAIGRHFIKDGMRDPFQTTFMENRKELDEYIGGQEKVVGGWRIDKDISDGEREGEAGKEKEEFVLFTGWESKDQHWGFAKMEGFEKYALIREWVEGADIMHAVRMEI